jgi:excinuclease ABC subunit A
MPEAKLRGYTKSRFSFNVAGGRCEALRRRGREVRRAQFLAPVTVRARSAAATASSRDARRHYQGRSIADVLAMTVEERSSCSRTTPDRAPAGARWSRSAGIPHARPAVDDALGRRGAALEARDELQKEAGGHVLYVLDEADDGASPVGRRAPSSRRCRSSSTRGNTVVVIEHNLDLALAADHLIDLGPEGGAEGGYLLAEGTPEEIEKVSASHTGAALRAFRSGSTRSRSARSRGQHGAHGSPARRRRAHAQPEERSASTSRARSSSSSPGPSGSGKSSLALDTIYTEGRRRFVESLSTYARQFLGTKDRRRSSASRASARPSRSKRARVTASRARRSRRRPRSTTPARPVGARRDAALPDARREARAQRRQSRRGAS